MTQPFDSGLTRSRRELVQDRIAVLVTPFTVAQPNGFLEAVEPIDFEVTGSDETLNALETILQGRAPAIAIAALGSKGTQTGGPGSSVHELDVLIYFVSRHARGLVDGRARADAISDLALKSDPGIFAAMELVWSRLFDADMKPATSHPMKLVDDDPVAASPDLTVWRQRWRVRLTMDANLARDITQKFLEAATKLHLQPDDPGKAEIDVTTEVG